MDTPTPRIYAALLGASADLSIEGIAKTRQNKQQGYAFRGIDEVLNAMSPVLVKHKIIVIPRMTSRACTERETKNGGVLFTVTVEADFDFVSAEDGSQVTVSTFGEAMDSADKATNKAMSAAYKYAAFLTLCIPLEGSMGEDADAATHEIAPKAVAVKTRPVPPAPATMPGRDAVRRPAEVPSPASDASPKINTAAVARLKALMQTHSTDATQLGREMRALWGYAKWSDIRESRYDLICRSVIEGVPLGDLVGPIEG